MLDLKSKFQKIKKTHLQIAGILLLVLLAVLLLRFNNRTSMQSDLAMVADVNFEGEYSIAGGPWQKIAHGEHIPSTKGDVTLRGNFHMFTPDGEYIGIYQGGETLQLFTQDGEYVGDYRETIPIAFYSNHINLTFIEKGNAPSTFDNENPLCGVQWVAYALVNECEDPIEIVVHNPHSFGNETAIDEMLERIAFYDIVGVNFEKTVMNNGETQRDIGLLFVIVALMLLAIAMFSALIHIENIKSIFMLGLVVLFAGVYFTYSAEGVSFWSESIATNTTLLSASMMFYMLFLTMSIVYFLKGTKVIGDATVIALGIANAVFFVLPMISKILFYDTLLWWVIVQIIANIILSVCLIIEFVTVKSRERWIRIGALLPLIAFATDVIGTWLGLWNGGLVSKYVFIALFAVAMIVVLNLIPRNINAATKAKGLEMEKIVLNAQLAESRISTMMSQIRPHFIYNTLGSIEQLCKLDPPKAGELVHNFAKYLRGNFGELDNPKPILMSQEMEHVHHYISIENVRFPDMTFSFEMNSVDFSIPALTIQPIVENAIKHGLMKLQKGGTIRVVSYETDTDYCVSVSDDGVGFDTTVLLDERKHVGLRNIRERLKVMVNGTLEIESTVGVGTKVLIKIPKEVC